MDEKTESFSNPNPLRSANFPNKLCFWWLKHLLFYGSKHDLEVKNLYDTLPKDCSEKLRDDLELVWKDELKNGREPSFSRALIRVYKWKFLKYLSLMIIAYILQLLQPLFLQLVMSYFHYQTETTITEAYIYVTIFILLMISQIFLLRHSSFRLMLMGMQIKTAVSSLMYKKLIRLSSKSASESSGASIITLLSNDVSKFDTIGIDLPYLVIFPLQVIVATVLVCQYVGVFAGLVGISLLVLQTIPPQAFMYNLTMKLRPKLAARSDIRISLLNEIINGIRAIKMYVWENYFEKLVQTARRKEIHYYLQIFYISSAVYAFTNFAQRLSTFAVILICTLQNNLLTSDIIIPMTQFLSIVGETITAYFFYSIKDIAYINVSITRIQEFLLREEKQEGIKRLTGIGHRSILFKNVTASWENEIIKPTVEDVDINVAVGELCVIVGSVGSGKSTLLKLILGEIHAINGDVFVRGTISYSSQDPWLFPASVRENIIFGETYDEKWYEQVTKACALVEDFNQMPFGDKTLVGDRGITLSGGQRARINLARSVYRKADVYLFDDPLSAVDARVAEILFDNCVNGLLKDKTRILVTNNLQYLDKADQIVLIEKGKIEFAGNFDGFQKNEVFLNYLSLSENSGTVSEKESCDDNENSVELPKSCDIIDKISEEEPEETEEISAKGNISASLYWEYIKASDSYVTLILFIISSIMVIISIAGFDYYLADSTTNEEMIIMENKNTTIVLDPMNTNSLDWYKLEETLYTFAGLVLVIVTSSILKNLLFYKFTLNASKNIHNKMFTRTLRTPLRFFETNPSGRILNRFSEDTGSVDDLFPKTLFNALDSFSSVAGMLLPVIAINVWVIVPMIIIGSIYYKLSAMYVKTVQGIKRLEGIAKSPVLSFATSSQAGAVTIRSCQVEPEVCKEFDSRQDSYIKAYFLVTALSQAFCCWLELLMALLFAIVAYCCVILKGDNEFAAFIGLSLMQILNVSAILSFTILQFAEMLARMVNVERMFQFTKLKEEGSEDNGILQKPDKSWPIEGGVKFDKLCLRYSDDGEPVLKNLTFTIEAGTKIGIVGRTGAGKSSLISALFRLTKIDGSLIIDGIDTKNIDLSDLRSKLSIIPQEPTLFNASLRENLDPFNEYDDSILWSALEDVELNKSFASLEYIINRGGSNLSSGQRQLLCLARAIVKNNKIMILDEATANIDLATDEFIQKTIRSKFKNCTVLTIAHRLNTIMDSDKVLVMDNGQAVEFDHPYILLQEKNGIFTSLVQKTGHAMSQNLRFIAKQSYERDYGEITRL